MGVVAHFTRAQRHALGQAAAQAGLPVKRYVQQVTLEAVSRAEPGAKE